MDAIIAHKYAKKCELWSSICSKSISNVTPIKPRINPKTFLVVSFSLPLTQANMKPQLGDVAFIIDKRDPGSHCAEYANKKNGNAALSNPKIMKYLRYLVKLILFFSATPIKKRKSVAKTTLTSVNTAGPSNGVHALIIINDPPHSAAVSSNLKKLTKVIKEV